MPVRVLVLAADPLARAGMAALLGGSTRVLIAGLASDRDDLEAAIAAYRPDVLLWDLGWDSTARIERLAATTEVSPPIVALLGDDGEAGQLWAAGARGVLARDVEPEALAAALAAAAAGLGVFGPGAGLLPPVVLPSPDRGSAGLLVEPLTPREMDVLRGVADGLSNKMIARTLEISEHTVKFHVNAILGKLGAQSRTDAVVRATRAGLLLL